METYAVHFDILKYIVFNANVKETVRNADDSKWVLTVQINGALEYIEFDKVVFCHGYQTTMVMPNLVDKERFRGTIIHAQEYRS